MKKENGLKERIHTVRKKRKKLIMRLKLLKRELKTT